MRAESLPARVKRVGRTMAHVVRRQIQWWTAHSRLADQVARFGYRAFGPATDLFEQVLIQTQNQCNYACTFCANRDIDRPRHRMPEGLFERIIGNLSRLQYGGAVVLNFQNEPLLDERLFSFVDTAGAMLPRARLLLHTNTSLLSAEKLERLAAAGLRCILNVYRESDRGNVSVAGLPPRLRRRVVVYDKTSWSASTPHLLNWAGNASAMPVPQPPLTEFCPRPFTMLCITSRGQAVLCCLDWRHEWVMGDASEETLEDIWAGERFQAVRRKLLHGDRSEILCSRCNKGWAPMPWRLLGRRAAACLSAGPTRRGQSPAGRRVRND